LKSLDRIDRATLADQLLSRLWQLDQDLKNFFESPTLSEMFRSDSPAIVSEELPFVPVVLNFPPAAHLCCLLLAVRLYIYTIIRPPIRATAPPHLPGRQLLWDDDTSKLAYEVCRTFAGVEPLLRNTPDGLFPYFSALVISGLACPTSCRLWLWSKLSDFEKLGLQYHRPVLKTVAIFWDMPNLVTGGFATEVSGSTEKRVRELSVDDISTATENLGKEDSGSEASNTEETATFGSLSVDE